MLTLRSKTVSVSLMTALLAGCSGSKPAAQTPQPEAKQTKSSGAALAGAEAQKGQDLGTPPPGQSGGGSSGNGGPATYPSVPGSHQGNRRVVQYSHSYESHSYYRYRRGTSCSSDNYKTDCGFDLNHKTKKPAPKAEEPKNVRSLETLASLEYTANGSVGGGGKAHPLAPKSLGSPTPLSSVPSVAGGALASTKEDGATKITYLNVRSDGGKSFDALRGLYNGSSASADNIVLADDAQSSLAKEWFTQVKKLGADAYIYQLSSTQDLSASGNVLKYELAIPVSTLQSDQTLTDRKNTPLSPFKADRIAKVSGEKIEADKTNKVLIIEAKTAGSANETLIKKGDWEQAIATMKPSVGRTIVTSKSADGKIKIYCWIGFPRVEKLAKANRKKEFEKLSQNQSDALAESSSICTISGLVD